MERMALGIKGSPDWHIIPNHRWREAWFYGKGPHSMPCGATGRYAGRLSFEQIPRWWEQYPDQSWCIDCLFMEATGNWPPDPVWQWAGT